MSELRGQRLDVSDAHPVPISHLPVFTCCLLASVFCFLTSVFCPLIWAEELKVGYVDMAKVFDGYYRTKTIDAQLETLGKQKETELKSRMEDLRKLRQGLELLSDQAREARERDIEEKSDELQRFRTTTARDLRREREKVAGEIFREIGQGITDYANANGFTLILDGRSLLYGQPGRDVSDAVLNLLNSRATTKRP